MIIASTIAWIISKRWWFILGGFALTLVGSNYLTWKTTKEHFENKQLKSTVTRMEVRNEIANNRPDTAAFLDGLLNDKEW